MSLERTEPEDFLAVFVSLVLWRIDSAVSVCISAFSREGLCQLSPCLCGFCLGLGV
jgi:hypothetical protein